MASDLPTASASFEAACFSATAGDPAEYELAVQPWELLCLPRQAGKFRYAMMGLRTRDFLLYREHYSLPVKLEGLAPDGFLGVALPLDYDHELVYWGKACPDWGLGASLPGPADAVLGGGHAQVVVMIDRQRLREKMLPAAIERLEAAARAHVLSPPPHLVVPFSRWCNSILGQCHASCRRVGTSSLADGILGELLDFLLRLSSSLAPERSPAKLTVRRRALARCLGYMRERVEHRIPVADLCRISGASERTLQYAFREAFGLSPTAFMRRRRLGAARRELVTASARETSVSAVAVKYGFLELGRFAVDYRRLFGLRPSESLRARPTLQANWRHF